MSSLEPSCAQSRSSFFTGVPRSAATSLLPAVVETLGPLPDSRGNLRPRRGMFVHFHGDRGQLLLHALAVAPPGGQLRGVPAAAEGEEQGGVGLEQGMELELETPGLWLHALSERQGRTLHRDIVGQEMLRGSKGTHSHKVKRYQFGRLFKDFE